MKTTTATNADRAPQTHRVAVYGSLRAGMGNHYHLEGARYRGRYSTPARFTMISLGGFPGLRHGGDTAAVCEVYDVDDATFAALDRLESNGRFYQRKQMVLSPDDGQGRGTVAWVYVLLHDHAGQHVQDGDWVEYYQQREIAQGKRWPR